MDTRTTRDRGIALTVVLLGAEFHRHPLQPRPLSAVLPRLAAVRGYGRAGAAVREVPWVPVRWFLLYACGFGIAQFLFLFLAMHLGMPGLASLVLQTSAPFTVVLRVLFLGERMTGRQVCGILLAVIGIAIIGFARATETDLGWGAVGPIAPHGSRRSQLGVRQYRQPAHRHPPRTRLSPARRRPASGAVDVGDPIAVPFLAMSFVFDGPTAGFDALTTIGSHSGLLAIRGLTYTVLLGTVAGSGPGRASCRDIRQSCRADVAAGAGRRPHRGVVVLQREPRHRRGFSVPPSSSPAARSA